MSQEEGPGLADGSGIPACWSRRNGETRLDSKPVLVENQ